MKSKKLYRAGVIPYIYQDGILKLMFMTPSDPKYGGSYLQIAKGKTEKNETTEQAAFREAYEELGLKKSNIVKYECIGQFLTRTFIFIAEISDINDFGETTHETGRTAWLTVEDFYRIGRRLHIPIVKYAVNIIKDVEVESDIKLKTNE